MNLALVSCNFTIKRGKTDLWAVLRDRYVATDDVDMVLHMGDQIYGDQVYAWAMNELGSFLKTYPGRWIAIWLMEKNAERALHGGVTTLRGLGDPAFTDVEVRERIESGRAVGPRLLASGPLKTTEMNDVAFMLSNVTNTSEAPALVPPTTAIGLAL